jgi:hypothetical protein
MLTESLAASTDVRFMEISTKYGGLYVTMYYVPDHARDRVLAAIQKAIQTCSVTCEVCGNGGHLNGYLDLKVRCSKCADVPLQPRIS